MNRFQARTLTALLGLFIALTAFAAGVELEPEATALVSDFEALEVRIDACPNGDCEDRAAIEADLGSLGLDLADLLGERDALEPCSDCGTLDALLDDAGVLAAAASETSGDWEAEG